MIETLLANLDTLLLYLFAACALVGAVLMLILPQPMRVALALISTMVFLGGVYGLLGVHFIAAFQVLVYVGAVMVFMVYAIMLLDVRDSAYKRTYSKLVMPGIAAGALFFAALAFGLWKALPDSAGSAATPAAGTFGLQQFAVAFLSEYWLHFELTSVLLVAAVVAALAVIKVSAASGAQSPLGTRAERKGGSDRG
ncbi:MAG: NADH-quinone oxidoreductase subunit J [Burkholderiales bacterium]|jgi:NADH-quinone oxidoreductase subunit J|nr:NADH-quinone oxidoreductase subunit J [Burkholderiales bacterium]